ncbi:MAG: hypothetical protein LBF22_02435 [Deltaproteobacteria bacterium]|jgi:hypothetical protein|nr:hypothetical protein [Deltaproteobacteria bacterium]
MTIISQNKRSFLTPFDFLRITRSSAISVVSTAEGPSLTFPRALEMEDMRFGELLAPHNITQIHIFLLQLLNLPNLDISLNPETRFKDYAFRLSEAFSKLDSPTIVFRSLDKAGSPRYTIHSANMLLTEANNTAFLYSGRKKILVTVPLIHSYGFVFGVVLPRFLKITATDIPPLPTLNAFPLQKGDLVVLYPQLLNSLTLIPPPDLALLCSSSPPLDQLSFKTARNLGFLSLTEVYGTAITGALGYRKSAGPYELFPHFKRSGSRGLIRIDTATQFSSSRITWRKERFFSHADEPINT